MRRYMNADFSRIFKRVPRWIVVAVFVAIFVAVICMLPENATAYSLVSMLNRIAPMLCPLFGLIEIMFVYGDDFKAKTMQVAIGTGVPRPCIVLAKWLETVLLTALDLCIILAVIFIGALIKGMTLPWNPVHDLLILFLFSLIRVIGCVGIVQMLMFFTQSSHVATLIYLIFNFEIAKGILGSIIDSTPLAKYHLTPYLLQNMENTAKSRLLMGTVSIQLFVGILLYNLFFYAVTCALFRKRELEF